MMLPEACRQMLRETECVDLEQLITALKQQHPEAFHTKESLAERTFYHQPVRSEPCRAYVTDIVPDWGKAKPSTSPGKDENAVRHARVEWKLGGFKGEVQHLAGY
ncbi:hypothetical protein [Burkholderia ubonensis]|uniref:hypothetical protein n=1 Tax=Burkholderia ubonensis TaxID=101571 RepID=UPI0012F8AC3C|nr:hypothetical protein [Burkholderia ubonensis]